MKTVVFRTSALSGPITPRTPVDEELLVHKNTDIIIDTYEEVNTVVIDDVTVYDSAAGPSFQSGWTGEVGQITGGWRIVLIPPVAYDIADHPEVIVNTASYSLSYISEIGTEQLTATNDASVPRILDIDGTNIVVGYGRDTGNIYLRKIEPDTGETKLVIGKHFALGYNPYTSKTALVFNINGSLFLTEADPADTPNTITDPTILKDQIETAIGSGHASVQSQEIQGKQFQLVHITEFPPIKKFLLEDVYTHIGEGRKPVMTTSPHAEQQAPIFISFDPPAIRIVRPTEEPEASALVGYYVVHYFPATGAIGSTHYVAIDPGDTFVDFEDTHTIDGVVYTVIPVYNFLGYGPDEEGPMSPFEIPPPTAGADIIRTYIGAGYVGRAELTALYTVLKDVETDDIFTHIGQGRAFSVAIEGFGSIGIGS